MLVILCFSREKKIVFRFHSSLSGKWIKYFHSEAETRSISHSRGHSVSVRYRQKLFLNANTPSFSVASCMAVEYRYAY
jgi:hypothetical protein